MADNANTFTVTRGADNEITILLTLRLTGSEGENVTLQTRVYPKNLPEVPNYKTFRIQGSGGNFSSWKEEQSTWKISCWPIQEEYLYFS